MFVMNIQVEWKQQIKNVHDRLNSHSVKIKSHDKQLVQVSEWVNEYRNHHRVGGRGHPWILATSEKSLVPCRPLGSSQIILLLLLLCVYPFSFSNPSPSLASLSVRVSPSSCGLLKGPPTAVTRAESGRGAQCR
ncbi:hypothetical protein EVAR_59097_1 [Eumeta japonica]|uniref:Uncharacterized protein n=1 Tax=Eumeta variegata TaxID=151549 RepID=A0A4C1YZP0_EUMVA|nr:hypothetical protein EVAR_59097_1 [Eumeta japonica]